MERKAEKQIDRYPGKIEQGQDPAARNEGADLVEIAQRQLSIGAISRGEGKMQDSIEQARAQRSIEGIGDTDENAGTNDIEERLRPEQHGSQHGQRHQGRHAAARQHTVIDLEHEHGARQHEDIDHEAEERDPQKRRPQAPKGLAQLG